MPKPATILLPVILMTALLTGLHAGESDKSVKFSGLLWAGYFHAVSEAPATGAWADSSSGQANEFAIDRVYLTATGKLAEDWTYKINYEFNGSGDLIPFAKHAYLEWNTDFPVKHSVILGLQDTPLWSTYDKFWGYRAVKKSPRENVQNAIASKMFNLKTWSATDLGLGLNFYPIEAASLQMLVANGSGGGSAESNMHKKIALALTVKPVPDMKWLFGQLYWDSEAGYVSGVTAEKEYRTSLGVLAGFRNDLFMLGVDWYQKQFPDLAQNGDNVEYDLTLQTLSFVGGYSLTPKFGFIARYDQYTPVTEDAVMGNYEKSGESLLIVGFDIRYGPPNTHFVLTYQSSSYGVKVESPAGEWVDRDPYGAVALNAIISF